MTKSATRSFADELGIDDNATSTAITIDASENVGIGTSSPSSYYSNTLVVDTSTENGITVVSPTTGTGYLMFADGISGNERYRGYVGYDHNTDSLQLATGGTQRLLIDSSGHAIIGGGVTLGNGQTYAAANTLDDYEEGTWTPSGTGINSGTSVGYYTKVGNVCHTQMWIHANGSTDGTITGLPFTQGHTNNAIAAGTIGYISTTGSVTGIVSAGQNTSILLYNGTATGSMVSGNQMHCAMTYRTT